MFRVKIFIAVVLITGFLAVFPVMAQTSIDDLLVSDVTATTSELENITVKDFTIIPSSVGLWWRTFVENISLATTIDPIKKTEKAIKYSEERLKLAEFIFQKAKDNPKLEDVALKMIERANELDKKIEKNRAKIVERVDEDSQRALRNVINHALIRAEDLDNATDNVQPDKIKKFQELRIDSLNESSRLLNAINNENIPEAVREKLQAVKNRIEEHASTTEAFLEDKKELLEKAADGDDSAKIELRQLREDVKQSLEENRERFRDAVEEMREDRNTTTKRMRTSSDDTNDSNDGSDN